MPVPNLPGRRRVSPGKFARPTIAVDATKREWRQVLAREVRVGDTVRDVGRVQSVLCGPGDVPSVSIMNVMDREYFFEPDVSVYAFVPAE